ncbi:MAG TPA: immunoglobulin domain-containing protein [Candidatus Didemnitutus sp.]|nr:immunoglobulin domain-containing protein [Candidatus Didemnitutus sp.]
MHLTSRVLAFTFLLIAGLFSAIGARAATATAVVGQSVTFSVSVSGTAPFSYQWYKDSAAISGGTSATYAIASVQTGDAGSYTVAVSNAYGSTNSDSGALTVSTASVLPAFTTQPTGATVSAGGSVTFTAAATGTPAPAFQWYFNGTAISGATASSLTLANVQSASAGSYTVAASNVAGTVTSAVATLTVSGVTNQLVGGGAVSVWSASAVPTRADAGADSPVELGLNFKSDVAGVITGVRFYKSAANTGTHVGNLWSSAGARLATATFTNESASGWQQVNFSSPVTIAANTVYTVSYFCPAGHYSDDNNFFATTGVDAPPLHALVNSTATANGVYTYGSSSAFPKQTWSSSNYWVDVVFQASSAPTLKSLAVTPSSSALLVGGTQSFVATGTYSDGSTQNVSTSVTWSSSNASVASIGTSGSAQALTAGSATITASLSGVSASATVTVTVPNVAPTISTQPASQTVVMGQAATFSVVATGTPAPTYQWRLNGTNISGATSASYSISSAQAANVGTYTVVVTNVAGSVTSSGATLTVNSAPVFTTQPVGQTVNAGSAVTFSAAATGTPAPTYQWKKNGTAISGATASSYTISSAQSTDAASYTVVATNSVGSATSATATLTVKATLPVISTQPFSQTLTAGGQVTFFVTASSSSSMTYQWYKNGSRISKATTATYSISSTATSDSGTYTVVVTNSSGSVTSTGAVLTVRSATPPAVYRVDFNGDGKSDVLLQDTVTGECRVWLMSGTRVSSVVSLGSRPGWTLIGAGDFNGDGKSDVLWQNLVTGEVSVWLMSGTKISSTVSLGTVALGWEACGTGDFNGDGKSDILWQNNLTGDRAIWLMAGTTVSSIVDLGTVSLDWQIAGAGDFNADGRSDILWQNSVTNQCQVWLMANTVPSSTVSLGTPAVGWEISGCGDFNNNGSSDIVLQNSLTGACQIWVMSGTKVSSTSSLGTVTLDWVLQN